MTVAGITVIVLECSGMEAIWQEDNCALWQRWLDGYEQAIAALANEKLTNLDCWFREELPLRVRERTPACIYADELQGIAAWKMHRGVWRERNRQLVASNPPEKVEEVSREAFAAVPNLPNAPDASEVRKPAAILCTLSGVGPATASAVLATYAPHLYPFFDELVAAFVPGLGPVAFSIPYYLKYAAALRDRADLLNSTCSSPHQGEALSWTPWSAHDVAQALWSLDVSWQNQT